MSQIGGGLKPPALEGRRVRLRIVRPNDYPFLFEMAMDPAEGMNWRYRSTHPGFEEFVQTFRNGVFLNFIVEGRAAAERLGYVACYNADTRNRHAYIGIQGMASTYNKGLLPEAAQLFIGYIFSCYEFEKLYAECPEFNIGRVRDCIGPYFIEEGRLRGHDRILDRAWDVFILAAYRDEWNRNAEDTAERRSKFSSRLVDQTGSGLEEEDFLSYLRTELRRGDIVALSMDLFRDLDLDSVGIFELISAVEDLGATIRDQDIPQFRTLQDVHFAYLQNRDSIAKPAT